MQNYSILSKFLKLITVQVKDENGKQHEVCSKTFLSIYCVTAERVRSLAAHKWQTDNPRDEQRGGKRLKPGYEDLKEEIKQHISRYRCVSSYYGRNKTPNKKYLPSTLNVLKMYRAFLEQYSGTLSVKYSLYYKVFVTSFNLGFGNPRTDVCSTCVKLKSTINATQEAEKKKMITELLVHKMRAKNFYSLLKEEHDDSVLTICFDLMQNQPLPKSPIGEAYYSRQLWQFFFVCLCITLENRTKMMWRFILGVSTSKAEEQTRLPARSLTLLKADWQLLINKFNSFVCSAIRALGRIKTLLYYLLCTLLALHILLKILFFMFSNF